MNDIVTIGGATLYHGDCLEILPTLPKVDAVVTDPPYGMKLDASNKNSKPNIKKGIGASKGYDDIVGDIDASVTRKVLLALTGIGEQLWWGADYYRDALPDGGSWFVWNKRAGMPDFDYTLSEFELCWSKQKKQRRIFHRRWFGLCGTETQDVRHRVHPAQKSIEVMMDCILVTKGQTILDPFMGSGTTGVACANLGRKFIGIEIERKYFDIACERIEAAYAQGRLFA